MRVTPTKEQMAYLASIGASSSTMPQPRPAAGKCQKEVTLPPHKANRRVVHWRAVLLVVVALLLSLVGIGRAEDKVAPMNPVVAEKPLPAPQDSNVEALKRLSALENELANVKKAIERGDLREQVAAAQTKIKDVEDRLRKTQEKLRGDLVNDSAAISKRIQSIESTLNQLKDDVTLLVKEHGLWKSKIEARIEADRSQADERVADAERTVTQIVATEIAALRESLATQRQDFQRTRLLSVTITVLAIGLLVLGKIFMEKRIRQVEMYAWPQLADAVATHDKTIPPSHRRDADTENEEGAHGLKNSVKVAPKRSQQDTPEPPDKQMAALIASAGKAPHIRVKPTSPAGVWALGLATIKGNVRTENQDYGLCFQTAGHDVLVVADGCGGIPHGQRASYLAAVSAAKSVIRSYDTAPRWQSPKVKDVAVKAIMSAAHSLAIEGDKLNITDVRGGLRTTLIVVVGNKREIGYAYIGDGGGCVVQSNGEVKHFLEPQKANGHAMNVLAASLGPSIEGEPVSGVLKREAGDILIVGTDGIFDRVEAMFPKDVLRGCIQYQGDLQKTAEHIVMELASYKDAAGYICDDNLTLGIMGDGTKPKLSNGFWASPNETECVHQELQSSLIGAQMKEGVS